jgi:Fe-S cluster assembly scaffold protein SufB
LDNIDTHISSKVYTLSIKQDGIHIIEGMYASIQITIATGIAVTIYDKTETTRRTILVEANASCTYVYYDKDTVPTLLDHIYLYSNSMLHILYAGTYTRNVKRSVYIFMQEDGAQMTCQMLQALYGNTQGEFDTKQYHQAPHTTSMLEVRKIMYDASVVLYNGIVHIDPHASGSNASQQDRTLLISNTARAQSRPALEVCTQEVHCAHGSALGTFDQEHIWYLQSRGILMQNAQRLLIYAFFSSVLQSIPENMRKEICSILNVQGIE